MTGKLWSLCVASWKEILRREKDIYAALKRLRNNSINDCEIRIILRRRRSGRWQMEPKRARRASGRGTAAAQCVASPASSGGFDSLRASTELRGGARQHVIFEAFAQNGLQDLAGCRVRNLTDECDVVRQPPFGDLAVEEIEQFLPARSLAFLEHDHEQGPLVPFRMPHADHGGFRDFGMADREVFQ